MTLYGDIPGHARSVQLLVSVLFPAHVFPPFCGGGLVHVLARAAVPRPQDVLHDPQCDQTAQTPSTETRLCVTAG